MIYGPFGSEISKVRRAQLADIHKYEQRKPDDIDRESVHRGSYVIGTWADSGEEFMTHLGRLRADGGSAEIDAAMEASGSEWRCIECGDVLKDWKELCPKQKCRTTIERRQRRMGMRR